MSERAAYLTPEGEGGTGVAGATTGAGGVTGPGGMIGVDAVSSFSSVIFAGFGVRSYMAPVATLRIPTMPPCNSEIMPPGHSDLIPPPLGRSVGCVLWARLPALVKRLDWRLRDEGSHP